MDKKHRICSSILVSNAALALMHLQMLCFQPGLNRTYHIISLYIKYSFMPNKCLYVSNLHIA